jgi:putative hydrolase of the HAD superfamily
VHEVLEELRTRRRLALISNYPDGQALRTSVSRTKLDGFFEVVVVSGDLGYVKPHPLLFRTALEQLGVEPAAAVHIGDNWLADVQGAKGMGMQVVLTEQWDKIEKFDPEPDDHQPDLVIGHFRELLDHL